MTENLTALGVAWDAWRATRGGPPGIHARQAARLDALVRHARQASPFYAGLYAGLATDGLRPEDLVRLPVVRKPTLMSHFDDWLCDAAVNRTAVQAFLADPESVGEDFLGRYVVFTTSGSTAEPAILVQDRRAMAVMNGLAYGRSAGVLPSKMMPRILSRGIRQAAVFAGKGHFLTATLFERRLREHPIRRRYSRYFSILDPLPELVAALNDFQPVMLSTYASALSVLAAEQEAGRLRIQPLVISSGGESLLPSARQRVERVFGAVVVQTYNASEVTPLSLPCRLGQLHVNVDWFLVEPVDSEGRSVELGRRSDTVLVTNLANYVQPLIRYELGDSVVMAEQTCPCGSALPTIAVEGRTDEVLQVPGADGGLVALLPLAISEVVEETPGVLSYQIVQTGSATLVIRLTVVAGSERSEVWQRVRSRALDFLRRQRVSATVTIELSAEPPAVNKRSGKLRHVLALPG
ncbi:phenylacetate--CoA ligase family protein [Mycolicibacterium sp.]|uniref:phenylacetate--CoA ligase family protein n=1 Tax=Mycolicibacterium sp. TaxID=2320850 RepID=UPI0025FBEE84|nr:phenylacetate--CoA ligase family protein [Mycolicibacterium sp.]